MPDNAGEALVSWFDAGDEDLATWVAAHAWFSIQPATGSQEPELYVRIGRNRDGRYACTGLIVGAISPDSFPIQPPEITARALRAIHLPSLIEAALASGRGDWETRVRGILDDASHIRPKIRRRQLDDAHFETVAAGYRTAMDRAPSRPTSWLADEWQVPEPTLRRWIQRARDKGLLGKSAPGRPGEYPAPHAGGRQNG